MCSILIELKAKQLSLLVDDQKDLNTDVICRNIDSAMSILWFAQGFITELYIDHNMGERLSGYDLIVWAIERELIPDFVQIVTENPVGRKSIAIALRRAGFENRNLDKVTFIRGTNEFQQARRNRS